MSINSSSNSSSSNQLLQSLSEQHIQPISETSVTLAASCALDAVSPPYQPLTGWTISVTNEAYERLIDDFITELPSGGWKGNAASVKRAIIGMCLLDFSRIKRIESLPDSIGNLANLMEMKLSYTHLTYLPDSIGRLANLCWLNLSHTPLTHLPEEIGNLHSLRGLDLSYTYLPSLPDSMGNLANLEDLQCNATPLTHLPSWIGNLMKLGSLGLYETQLRSLPRTICNLQDRLGVLALDGCCIVKQSDATTLGRQELREVFGNKVHVHDPNPFECL